MSTFYDYNKLIEKPKNMKRRRKNLEFVNAVLSGLGLKYWLYEGALLGFYRENKFIDWDFDVDIMMSCEDLLNNWKDIDRAISPLSCFPNRIQTARNKLKIDNDGEKISINGYLYRDGMYIREPYRMPDRWFGNGYIEQWGIKYPCPTPIEEYLEWAYGDWKTPIKSGNPRVYRRWHGVGSFDVELRYKRAKERGEY